MAQLTLFICDHCQKESREKPAHWQELMGRSGVNQDVEYKELLACSLGCLLHIVAESNVDTVAINSCFAKAALVEFNVFNNTIDELKTTLQNVKLRSGGGATIAPKATPEEKKIVEKETKQGKKYHSWSDDENKFLLSISKNELPSIAEEKYRKRFKDVPATRNVTKSAVKTRFKNLHQGLGKKSTTKLNKEDKKQFQDMEVRSEPIGIRAPNNKPPEQSLQRLSGTFKKYSLFTDESAPWLEQFMVGPFVKTEPCMDEMRGEWNVNRFVAVGLGLLTSTSQLPDGAFLQYIGNYILWVPPASVAALTSVATANGMADNLVEVTD